MIPGSLRVVLIFALIIYFVIILMLLKNKTLELKYTLLWMFSGFILALLVVWPEILEGFVRLIGIQSNMNGLFIMAFAFVIIIMMSLTSIVSKQANKIKLLIQELSIMEKRIRDLEKNEPEDNNEKETGSDKYSK